jgi:hypothetical protein
MFNQMSERLESRMGSMESACPSGVTLTCAADGYSGQGYGTATRKGFWSFLFGASDVTVKYGLYNCTYAGGACSFSGPGNPEKGGYDLYGIQSQFKYIPSVQGYGWVQGSIQSFTIDPNKPEQYPPQLWDAIRKGITDCRAAGTCK